MGCVSSSPSTAVTENLLHSNPIEEEIIDTSNMTPEQLASLSEDEIATIEMKKLRFFRRVKLRKDMNYVIMVDKSGSMRKENRWKQAREAVSHLAPGACCADADGVTLYFFSSRDKGHEDVPPFTKFDNVKSADQVMQLFDLPSNAPRFGTDMWSVLNDAIISRNTKSMFKKGLVILMITDGAPDDKQKLESLIVETANSLQNDGEVGISFIQVGDDEQAKLWLQHLDDDLTSSSKGGKKRTTKAKFDIVDTMSVEKLKGLDMANIVRLSLQG